MFSNLQNPEAGVSSLPQCGFGADIDFDTLIKANHFLFRVYTPKERSPFSDDTDPFFVAPRFDEQFARSPVDLPNIKFSEPVVGSYAEVARHMEWTTRSSSTYISTSFSFSWAIWEAVRRYHSGVKKDVEIAIIDATALGGRAATAAQLLRKASQKDRTQQYWKWHRFSHDSQSVLVYGMVPRTAVLASVPLLQILRKMPSYFLRKDMQLISGNPLDQAAWDYTNKKVHYRQFCQDMSKMFLDRPIDVRLRDSTAGAVRLALSFLRPFFHRVVQDDFDTAISYLRALAITISGWPGDWWVRDHPEVQQIVESMVLALGEELREKYASQQKEEITRLHVVIDGLEQTIRAQSTVESSKHVLEDVGIVSDGDFELEFEETDEPTLVAFDNPPAVRHRPSLKMSVAVLPRIPVSFQTPITPPESPRNSFFIPTVTVPLAGLASNQLSFKSPIRHVSFEEDLLPSKATPNPGSPTSPPPSPRLHASVFSPPQPYQDTDSVSELGEENDDNKRDVEVEQSLIVEPVAQETEPVALEVQTIEDERADEPLEEEIDPNKQPVDEEDIDDGEETEHDTDNEGSPPPSPFSPWVPIGRSAAYFSSPRSSIMSIETLCEPEEFPSSPKRMSSYSDSFEFVPRIMPMRSLGLASRTVSFSEPPSRLLLPMAIPPSPPVVDPVTIPLPPSPPVSVEKLPSPSLLSRSPSLSSTSSSFSAPPSPILLLDPHLPISSPGQIIPPKRPISLLSPLPEQDFDDDTLSTLSTNSSVTETASYIVTGFLVGAFLTLFLFSTQRRTILYLT